MAKIINFGKHKGKRYEEVREEDPGYCSWALKQAQPTGALAKFVDWLKRSDGFEQVPRNRFECATCKGPIDFAKMTDIQIREYHISFMCQRCQDKIFKSPSHKDEKLASTDEVLSVPKKFMQAPPSPKGPLHLLSVSTCDELLWPMLVVDGTLCREQFWVHAQMQGRRVVKKPRHPCKFSQHGSALVANLSGYVVALDQWDDLATSNCANDICILEMSDGKRREVIDMPCSAGICRSSCEDEFGRDLGLRRGFGLSCHDAALNMTLPPEEHVIQALPLTCECFMRSPSRGQSARSRSQASPQINCLDGCPTALIRVSEARQMLSDFDTEHRWHIVSEHREGYGIQYRIATHWPRKRLRAEIDECLQNMEDPSLEEVQRSVCKRYRKDISGRREVNNERVRTKMDGTAVATLHNQVEEMFEKRLKRMQSKQ
eukprot:TRINITY_DN28688_c0_g1_i1.p1 TRINITY_DN28688_c0_g1~~TRINITY_DN28688_c0_g1_i1.p1  ORF type:complete len:457 (+),score=68.92 TRINITY_DN28688_c0_g1_i1:84-1373(+)